MERPISLEEEQKIMLGIMRDFANFCEEHNLRYFLDAGTLLGAVRHHGFIPWDNDADVCMPRPDMDIFISLLKERNYMLNDHIVLERPEDSIFTFFKLGDTRTKMIEYPNDNPIECYVYIDLFCKDGLPADLKKVKRICDKSERYALLQWFDKYSVNAWRKRKNPIKKIIAIIANKLVKNKNRGYFKQKKFIKKVNKKYPYDTCKYVVTLSNGEFYRICLKEYFEDYVLEKFEGYSFRIPIGYDGWLKVLYGENYMIPPPKEKQEVHEVEMYWRNDANA